MLRLPRFQLIEPTTWTQAAMLLREHGAAGSDVALGTPSVPVMLVAGGTDLFPNMKRRQFAPPVLVALGRVKGAREISSGSGMRIAAGATLTEVATHPAVRAKYAALAQAAGVVSTPQLRNMGTIGGNLCLDTRCNWYDQSLFWRTAEGFCMKTHPSVVCRVAPSSARCLAVASADTVPALIALGAKVTVENASGRRDLDLAELYREDGIRYLAIGRDDVVIGVTLPDATGWRSTYLKLRDRNAFDFPIAGVAAAVRFDGTTVTAERFGGKKLLAPIDGEPLLDHTIRSLLDGGVSEVIVVVGTDARPELERDVNALNDPRVRPVENPDPSRGMFSSIQAGVTTANGDALVILPGDMPYVRPETVRAVIAKYREKAAIVSPRYRGKRGHPVIMPLSLRDEIAAMAATATLHDVIHHHQDERVDLDVDDPGVGRDVDTPADLR